MRRVILEPGAVSDLDDKELAEHQSLLSSS